jgi:hypothetical protein
MTRPHNTAARQSHHLSALRQHLTQHTPMISSTPVAAALGTAGCRGTGSLSAQRRPTMALSHRHRGRSVAVKATGKDSTVSPTTRQGPRLRGLVLRTLREDKGNLVSVPLNHHIATRAAVASHCCGVGMGLLGLARRHCCGGGRSSSTVEGSIEGSGSLSATAFFRKSSICITIGCGSNAKIVGGSMLQLHSVLC